MHEQGQSSLPYSSLAGELGEVARFVEVLRHYKQDLKERYKVKSLGIFGSYVRNEQKRGSDLDVLVEFYDPPSLLRFLQLEHYLSDLLGVRVDMVMKDVLKPAIGRRIFSEVVFV